MTGNLFSKLRNQLDARESLLWIGKPKSGILFRPADIFLIPFSLLWCGFAIFWVYVASQAGGMFFLFGIPFVLVGLMFVFGRFILDALQRKYAVYGLTENRIIIRTGIFAQKIKSINLRTLTDIELNERSKERGTITLGPQNIHPYYHWGSHMNLWPGINANNQLEMIDDARKVYRQILDLQKQSLKV